MSEPLREVVAEHGTAWTGFPDAPAVSPNAPTTGPESERDDAAPTAIGTPPSPPKRRGPGRPRKQPLEPRLREFFAALGGMLAIVNQTDGTIVMINAERLAKSWSRLADQNASVRRTLEMMMTGSAWTETLIVSASVLIAIAANHHLVPQNFSALGGVVFQAEPESDGAQNNGSPG